MLYTLILQWCFIIEDITNSVNLGIYTIEKSECHILTFTVLVNMAPSGHHN